MTNPPTPPFKVQKYRERWERIDKTTGEVALSGWSGHALYRITYADKTVGIFPTGADKIDPAPPPNGYLVEPVQVLDDTLPDLDISAVWVVTTTSHSTRHGGETYYHPHWWMDLSVSITDPNVTLEHLEELKLKSINRIPKEQRRHISSVKLLANLTESLKHHEPHH
jgi:hypothetical protein